VEDSAEFWRDPKLPYVESRRACSSRVCYRPHSHSTWSIGAVDDGVSVFSGAGPATVTLRPGTLVFVPPLRVHACNPAPERAWSYQMLHLDADWVGEVMRESETAEPDSMIELLDDAAAYQRFCTLNALLFSDAGSWLKEAALVDFVAGERRSQGIRIAPPAASDALRRQLGPVIDRLSSTDLDAASLTTLAALADMGRYQLIRAFRAVTGLTPHAWYLNHRINLARERLRAGDALVDVAHGLGFADQSHFQRVFKAHAGLTPRRYRS
jgi:AraC-like DNA-binding protein